MNKLIYLLALFLLSTLSTLITLGTLSHADSTIEKNEMDINSPEDLNTICIKKSLIYFKEKNKTPRDWTSQWRTEKNIIDVQGTWKVDNTEYVVLCRIKRGLKETMTFISIDEKSSVTDKNSTTTN